MRVNEIIPVISASKFTAANVVIHKGPCLVTSVTVTGDGATADCKVYDGLNAKGKLRLQLKTYDGLSHTWSPGGAVDFDYGIYVVVDAATTKVTVTYIPESRKDYI